jgi:MFS family permease
MAGLSALLLGLNQGHAWGWTSLPILTLLLGAVILLVTFLIIEFRAPDPMFDLSLLRRPQFSFSIISAILNYICIYTSIFLMPFYLIQGRGFNSAQAGLLLTAQPIIMAIIAPLSGTLSDKIGAQIPAAIGMAILATGLFFISRLGLQSMQSSILVALAVVGLGTGIFISPNNSALMGSAPRHQQGIAAGILATARNFGMVLGVGLAGAIFLTIATQRQGSGTLDNITALPSLYAAFKISFLVASGIGILGVFTSIIRGPNPPS